VTGLLSTCGRQFEDWSAAYRLFARARLEPEALFDGIGQLCHEQLPAGEPVRICLDDSLLPKSGARTPGVAWRRDPQGPPFQTNFVRAQRVLQMSALMPVAGSPAVRAVPVDFVHAPTPPRPARKAAAAPVGPGGQKNLTRRALERIEVVKARFGTRPIWLLSDARFTTGPLLQGLPPEAVLIGRLRKDARLWRLPGPQPARGRRRLYGEPCPTPEQMRQDPALPWQTVRVHAAGTDHDCRIKVVDGVQWRPAGPRPLRLVLIAPLAYRPRHASRLLYREPAYLLCTDPNLPPQQIVQAYFQRWDIEVNFRDQKSLLGVGQAQVRHPRSVQAVPAFQVAAYALLLLAALQLDPALLLPPPKWHPRRKSERASTHQLLQRLRFEVWGRGLGLHHFSGFSPPPLPTQTPQNLSLALPSALLYAYA
jgi:hypothetical protein